MGYQMASFSMAELVSQAENEGVTLAEVIARTMTKMDMDQAQAKIESQIAKNYAGISDFMSEISVPSIEEILEAGFNGFGVEFAAELPLSDESGLA